MSKYVSVAVPFNLAGNRRYLDRTQLEDGGDDLMDFVKRFEGCFDWDCITDRAYFIEAEDPLPVRRTPIPFVHR